MSGNETRATALKGLVVDDDPHWGERFVRYFDRAGLQAHHVTTLNDAINALDHEFYHVALVDLSLVGEQNRDGLEVLTKIYSEPREGTEAILLTAYGGVEEGKEATEIGAFDVLGKARPGGLEMSVVQNLVHRAAEQAVDNLSRYRPGLQLFVGGTASGDLDYRTSMMSTVLNVGSALIDKATRKLLSDLEPLMLRKMEPVVSYDTEMRTVYAAMWSKMLGRQVCIFLARDKQTMDDEISNFSVAPQEYREGRFETILRVEERIQKRDSELSGFVLVGKAADYDQYFLPEPASA